MPKIVLGKTPEQLAEEEAKARLEKENEIRQAFLDRQEKVIRMHKAQKRNRITVIGVFAIILIACIIFGTYNTFFKQSLTPGDVRGIINAQINSFPMSGLDNYVRDNCESLFYQSCDYNMNEYDYVEIDKNSVYVTNVRDITDTLAEVYFSADVLMKEKDTAVDDPAIIDRLHRNGFGQADPTSTPTPAPTETSVTPTVESVAASEPETTMADTVENIEEMSYTGGDMNIVPLTINYDPETPETTVETQPTQPTETQPVETQPEETQPTENPDNKEIGKVDMSGTKGAEADEYYIVGNGTIYKRGKVLRVRYNFYLPVEWYYKYDTDGRTPVAAGYRPAANMNMYVLEDINQVDFEKITIHPNYSFENIKEIDENTSTAARIKVDNILNALYGGRDTTQDFYNYRKFNTYGAEYVGMVSFQMYEAKNAMGYNCYVVYNIKTQQGFTYQVNCYMLVEPVGSGQDQTWKITKIT